MHVMAVKAVSLENAINDEDNYRGSINKSSSSDSDDDYHSNNNNNNNNNNLTESKLSASCWPQNYIRLDHYLVMFERKSDLNLRYTLQSEDSSHILTMLC